MHSEPQNIMTNVRTEAVCQLELFDPSCRRGYPLILQFWCPFK